MEISIYSGAFVAAFGLEEGYQKIADAGFTTIDWALPKAWSLSETEKTHAIPEDCYLLSDDFETIKEAARPRVEAARKAGLTIGQAHAPIGRLYVNNPRYTESCIKAYVNTIKACGWIGCPYLIIHPLCRPIDGEMTYEEIMAENIKLFSGLIPEIKASGVKVCLENTNVHSHAHYDRCAIFFDNAYDAVYLIDTLNEMAGRECFAYCLDTGHLNLGRKTPREFINILGHRLQTLHLHDNHLTIDNHYSPKHGTVDWDEVIDGLRDIGYRGNLNFETAIMPYYNGLLRYGHEMKERILAK